MVDIYTRTGDKGKTSLYDGLIIPKNDLRIHAVGELDELVSFIGLSRCHVNDARTGTILRDIQKELFNVGAEIASEDRSLLKKNVSDDDWHSLERLIDNLSESLEAPDAFILPGDNQASAHIHVCRSICRRLERRVVTLAQQLNNSFNQDLLIYINRLSDLFYVLARYNEAHSEKVHF